MITGAFQAIGDAVRARDTSGIESRMRFCNPIETSMEEDIGYLFYAMATDISIGFVTASSYTQISDACDLMTGRDDPENPPESDLDGFSRWFSDSFLEDAPCLEYNRSGTVELMSDESYDSFFNFFGMRQTIWLYCTQFGQFPTSNRGEGHPFGEFYEEDFFINFCADVFGKSN